MESADLGLLLLGQEAGDDPVEADGVSHGARRPLVVAGEHHRRDPERLERGDRLRGAVLLLIGQGEHAGEAVVDGPDHHGLALVGQPLDLLLVGLAEQPLLLEPVRSTEADLVAVHAGLDAETRAVEQLIRLAQLEGAVGGVVDDRLGQRVTRALLGAGEQRQRPVALVISRDPVGDPRGAAGDGAGLVEHDRGDPVGHLEGLSALEEDARPGAPAHADHDRRGRGQPQGAGAGDHQHRHHPDHRRDELAADEPPQAEGHQGDDDDRRDEDRRHPVGQPLDRRLRPLCLADQPDDLGQRRLIAHSGGADTDTAREVDRRAEDLDALGLLHRHGLAGEHALVDGRGSGQDLAVDGDLLAGTDHHDVVGPELARVDVAELFAELEVSDLGLELDQGADGGHGASAGPGLEELPQPDEGNDHGRGLEVDMAAEGGDEEDHGGVEVGHGRAQGDEHVHVGAAGAEAAPGATVEGSAGIELHRGGQGEEEPGQPGGGAERAEEAEIAAHAEDEEGEGKGDADPEGALLAVELGLTLLLDGGPISLGALGGGGEQEAEASAAHHLAQGLEVGGAGVELDGGGLGGEVDRRPRDAGGLLSQHPLDILGAVGAVHPDHRQVDPLWLLLFGCHDASIAVVSSPRDSHARVL